MKKTFETVDKKGRLSTWEWEETPEAKAAIARLHAVERLHNDIKEAHSND
tara:strand:+ start:3097 stop:3246 length:150 start_codon:yes stop_codon:yes gene_type:complete